MQYRPHFFVATRPRARDGDRPVDTATIEQKVEELGFEVVTLERGGGRRRPRLSIRIDRPGSEPGRSGVSVEDCARVTRTLRALFEESGAEERDWILEVSSPGVERPLVKPGDFVRFAGQRVRLRGHERLAGRGRVLEGTLVGLVEGRPEAVVLQVAEERVEIPLSELAGARLVYNWASGRRAAPTAGEER